MLAALLLARGDTVSVRRLVDAVWYEDTAPPTAEKQVRNTVSELRRLCPELECAIDTVIPGYRLTVAEENLDSGLFTEHVARAYRCLADGRAEDARHEFQAAMALWRGTALAGIHSAAIESRAVGLNEQRLTAVEEWLELELERGSVDGPTMSMLVDLVEENPYRERLVGHLMLALCRSGAQSRALAVFQSTREVMIDELGVEPGPALQEIYSRVRAQDVSILVPCTSDNRTAAQSTLPADIGRFVGRRAIVEELSSEVADGAESGGQIVTIDGMAGVGKTTLAIHLAHRIAHCYPDGQFFVELHTHAVADEPVDTATALRVLLRAANVPDRRIPTGLAELAAMWRAELAQRSMVVVLDDAASTAQMRGLIAPSAKALTIVTSRHRLSGMDFARVLSLDTLDVAEGRELFTRIVGDDRPLRDPDSVDAIVEHCGCLPLAIRIAAARVRHRPMWTLAEFMEHIAADRRRITDLSTESQSVTAAFEASYRRLSAAQRHVFRSVGNVADIDPISTARIADLSVPCAEQLLEQLVDVHLLQQSSPGRYQMHPLLRTYASGIALTTPPTRTDERLRPLRRAI